MAGRRRRGVPSACSDCLQKSKFIWFPSVCILVLGILVIIFEKLPQAREGQVQGITQIKKDLAAIISVKLAAWRTLTSTVSLNRNIPSWLPVWKINKPSGTIDRRLPPIKNIDKDAHKILPLLDDLKEHKFFRIFKTDLSKECPFWARREMCTNPGSCQICECDEDQIPKPWKMSPVKNFVDRNHYHSDGIRPWGVTPHEEENDINEVDNEISEISKDSSDKQMFNLFAPTVSDEKSKVASYVDLTLNRPGYTAYRGRNIWGLIYKENCMPSNPLRESNSTTVIMNECTEEEAFYKIISGMQTVIMILSAEYHDSKKNHAAHVAEIEYLKKTGQIVHASTFRSQYTADLSLFKERVAIGKEWMENLYFTFGVLLKTFCHVSPILEMCDCDTGTPEDDASACQQLQALLKESFYVCHEKYSDEPLFLRKKNLALRQFQNISRIMDCLECEKCRLHGKVKILAIQLALKVSGKDARIRKLERNEVIALVNALEYFADGIVAIHRFEQRLLRMRIAWVSSLTLSCIGIVLVLQKYQNRRRSSYIQEKEEDSTTDDSCFNKEARFASFRAKQIKRLK